MKYLLTTIYLFMHLMAFGQEVEVYLINEDEGPLNRVELFIVDWKTSFFSNQEGIIPIVPDSTDGVQGILFKPGYESQQIYIDFSRKRLDVQMSPLAYEAESIEVTDANHKEYLNKLNDIYGTAIYASKKSELIRPSGMTLNVATDNPRQIYATVPGLNIWESDGVGLQLSIGARGLDPNRSANFNTRQNGYDMSADALGYPESYYTPPTEALKQIEIVRGAASLQYGPQFGGLLNFQLKDGDISEPLKLQAQTTVGSYDFINGFLSAEGQVKNVSYFAFLQRKQGGGWRENTKFHQNTGHANITWRINSKLKIKADATRMTYLAQQPGGLQDFQFESNPRLSHRNRNWFSVNWNLFAISADYQISTSTRWNTRVFHLNAGRSALGELGPINRPDPMRERELIDGDYNNIGIESRMLHRYKLGGRHHHLVVGGRGYRGKTTNKQGLAGSGADAEFEFISPDDVEGSAYHFPGYNVAFFAENVFRFSKAWSITPGIRMEHIKTTADGYYKNRVFAGNQLIFEETIEENKRNSRQFILLGLGTSYRLHEKSELYANFSQNYRSINFSDIAITNPNLIIDQDLEDERGYNIDLGFRGVIGEGIFKYDVSLFTLQYNNRIGLNEKIIEDHSSIRSVAFRTNIGNAEIWGIESYLETNFVPFSLDGQPMDLQLFTNISVIRGIYSSGPSSVRGNQVEQIPPLNIRSGWRGSWKNFTVFYLFSYTHQHFSDASNASFVSDATRGLIPSYWVQDLTLGYRFNSWNVSLTVNNLANRNYFTRRATGYPGPGIIPADGRTIYFTLGHTLGG